jgi:hypothetical protein
MPDVTKEVILLGLNIKSFILKGIEKGKLQKASTWADLELIK